MSKMPSIAETIERVLREAEDPRVVKKAAFQVRAVPGGYRSFDPEVVARLRQTHGDAHVDQMLAAPAGDPTATKQAYHTLASALRDLPEPELSYEVLHVVKTAMILGEVAPLPPPTLLPETGSAEVLGLRKLANALRVEDHGDHSRLLAQGAHALKASRGVMLLRELVRE